jgi:hypothetical protein
MTALCQQGSENIFDRSRCCLLKAEYWNRLKMGNEIFTHKADK